MPCGLCGRRVCKGKPAIVGRECGRLGLPLADGGGVDGVDSVAYSSGRPYVMIDRRQKLKVDIRARLV